MLFLCMKTIRKTMEKENFEPILKVYLTKVYAAGYSMNTKIK